MHHWVVNRLKVISAYEVKKRKWHACYILNLKLQLAYQVNILWVIFIVMTGKSFSLNFPSAWSFILKILYNKQSARLQVDEFSFWYYNELLFHIYCTQSVVVYRQRSTDSVLISPSFIFLVQDNNFPFISVSNSK